MRSAKKAIHQRTDNVAEMKPMYSSGGRRHMNRTQLPCVESANSLWQSVPAAVARGGFNPNTTLKSHQHSSSRVWVFLAGINWASKWQHKYFFTELSVQLCQTKSHRAIHADHFTWRPFSLSWSAPLTHTLLLAKTLDCRISIWLLRRNTVQLINK